MNAEAPTSDRATRATIAQLTLTLRATEREAAAAEAAEAGWELDVALAQLRTRMTPLVEQRRRVLDDELALEHLKAADARAAAEIEAAEIVESARAALAAAAAAFADVPMTIDPDVDIVAWDDDVAAPDDGAVEAVNEGLVDVAEDPEPEVAPLVFAPDAVEPDDAGPVDIEPDLESALDDQADNDMPAPVGVPIALAPPQAAEPTITVTLDPDAFARAFAAAFGALLDERLASMAMAPPQQPQHPQWVQVAATPPERRSFWANAWHADVILSLVAALIVVVILIAWST